MKLSTVNRKIVIVLLHLWCNIFIDYSNLRKLEPAMLSGFKFSLKQALRKRYNNTRTKLEICCWANREKILHGKNGQMREYYRR